MASIPWLADVLRAAGVAVVEEGVFYRIANGTLEHRFFIDTESRLSTDNWGGTLADPS
jgi:hypothetical protein